jgi:hypothetical protein
MIVTQELLDVLENYPYAIEGGKKLKLGDSLMVLVPSRLGGDVSLYCKVKSTYLKLPDYVVEEFINVS